MFTQSLFFENNKTSSQIYLNAYSYNKGSQTFSNNCFAYLLRSSMLLIVTNTWYELANMFDKRRFFCTCAFVDKIFILGGYRYNDNDGYILNKSCLQYETKNKNWKEISGMTVERDCAACTVIKGNIVVSGGTDNFDNDLKSV